MWKRWTIGGMLALGLPWQFVVPANNERSPTNRGRGTGQIDVTEGTFITVHASNPNNILTLPDPVTGVQLVIHSGYGAYNLQASRPEEISINGGKGSGAKSRISTGTTVFATCVEESKWIAYGFDRDGDIVLIPPAAP